MDRLSVLQAYVRLAELRSFTAVADELRVKQATISKWMTALEEELGVQLLDRTTRALRVTDAGRRFYEGAKGVVADYQRVVEAVREDADALVGRIRMSVPVVFGHRFVTPLVADFLKSHPDLELELLYSDRYVDFVEEGFDIALRVGVPIDSTLTSHALGEGFRRLVASPDYIDAAGRPQTPDDLRHHQCLTHTEPRSRAALWTFQRGKDIHKVTVGGRVSANHSEATLHMAEEGLGIALLAHWLVEAALRDGTVVPLLEDYQPAPAPVRALTPPGRRVVPRVRAMIDHLRAALPQALGSPSAGA